MLACHHVQKHHTPFISDVSERHEKIWHKLPSSWRWEGHRLLAHPVTSLATLLITHAPTSDWDYVCTDRGSQPVQSAPPGGTPWPKHLCLVSPTSPSFFPTNKQMSARRIHVMKTRKVWTAQQQAVHSPPSFCPKCSDGSGTINIFQTKFRRDFLCGITQNLAMWNMSQVCVTASPYLHRVPKTVGRVVQRIVACLLPFPPHVSVDALLGLPFGSGTGSTDMWVLCSPACLPLPDVTSASRVAAALLHPTPVFALGTDTK